MNMFGGNMVIVHWPYSSDNSDEKMNLLYGWDEKMNPLYGWGDNIEVASRMFLERNGLLP